jgi:hypothetical protein
VELTWNAFGSKGTHFLRREIRNDTGEVEWLFETAIWDPKRPREVLKGTRNKETKQSNKTQKQNEEETKQHKT